MKKEIDALNFLNKIIDEDITPGKVIRARRLSLGLTQKDLAELTGMQPTFISSVENDKRAIGVHSALKLAVAIGLHPTSILFPNGVEMNKELQEIERKRQSLIKKVG
jgi:transcriptional regulator with XRE-family HTH domain